MKKILLVDSDILFSKAIYDILTKCSYKVTRSHDAEEAIVQTDDSRPDLVIIELILKNRSGMEFIHEFRSYSEWKNIPIIILSRITELDSGLSLEMKRSLSIVNFIYKPDFDKPKFIKIVESSLNAH